MTCDEILVGLRVNKSASVNYNGIADLIEDGGSFAQTLKLNVGWGDNNRKVFYRMTKKHNRIFYKIINRNKTRKCKNIFLFERFLFN